MLVFVFVILFASGGETLHGAASPEACIELRDRVAATAGDSAKVSDCMPVIMIKQANNAKGGS